MSITDISRHDLRSHDEGRAPRTSLRPAEARALRKDTLVALAAVMIGALAALLYASLTGIDDWSQLVVLGGIVLATLGVMIATDPLRR
jgi:hypothetical protein